MRKTIYLASMLLASGALMAQAATPAESGAYVDVETFGGMMALVTVLVTELCKVVAFIDAHKWAKVLCSVVVGIASTMVCWALHVSDYLEGLVWWQALLSGVAVGLSAAGFYDVIKALWSVFKPKEEDTITYNGKQ